MNTFPERMVSEFSWACDMAKDRANVNGAPVLVLERDGWFAICEEPTDMMEPDPITLGWSECALRMPTEAEEADTVQHDACPICGTVAPLSDATEHGITWDEPVCDECRQRARDAMHGPQTRYDISGD